MKSHISILLVMASILFGACSGDSVGPENSGPIMPLKVGNRWIGRTEQLDKAGNVSKTDFDTLEIVAEDVIDGEIWYVTNRDLYYTNRSDGLWQRPYGRGTYVRFVAKHPAGMGDVFGKDTIPILHTDSLVVSSYRVTSTGGEVNVPAGTFRAIRYMDDLHNLDGTLYAEGISEAAYAPGIGMIEDLNIGFSPTRGRYVWMKWELIEADLK